MSDRCILHSDANAFFASVETVLHPEYIGKAIAVCGSTEERHGIVLAKSEKAKKAGVKTGMVNHDAKSLCPELIIVPPSYEMYLKYSKMLKEIYSRYTDLVEPFGLDECWLDVTGSIGIFGSGYNIANEIRECVKRELGITVSIGVSFNKVFAKLGSDIKKPDAVTVITRDNYKEKVWCLAADSMIFIGRSVYSTLLKHGIVTLGDLANAPTDFLKRTFGVNGIRMSEDANGNDSSPVLNINSDTVIKSVSHGTTTVADMKTPDEVKKVILYLSQDISHRLRISGLRARRISLATRDCNLFVKEMQKTLQIPTQSPKEIALTADKILDCIYTGKPIRSVSVRTSMLSNENDPYQTDIFSDTVGIIKRENLDAAVDTLRTKYGSHTILPASLIQRDALVGKTEPIVSFSYMKR